MRLALHLEGRQSVVFRDTSDLEAVLNGQKHSRLTRWFRANEKFPSAHCIMFSNFPDKFEWDKSRHEWKERLKGHGTMIGRVYSRVGIGFGFVGSGRVGFGFRFRFRIGFGFEVDQLELCA